MEFDSKIFGSLISGFFFFFFVGAWNFDGFVVCPS